MWPPGGDAGGDVWPATGVDQRDRAALGRNRLEPCPLPFFAGDGDASGSGPMWPAGGDGGGDSRPEIGAAPSGRVDLVHDRLVPGLHHFFPVNGSSLGGPVGGCSGWPAAGTRTMESDDLEPFTRLDDEAWMGK
nr:uncharacterized protein LOC127341790 [Lolium perenne]